MQWLPADYEAQVNHSKGAGEENLRYDVLSLLPLSSVLIRRHSFESVLLIGIDANIVFMEKEYLAPKIWNALPEALKQKTKLNTFKERKKKTDNTQFQLSVHS